MSGTKLMSMCREEYARLARELAHRGLSPRWVQTAGTIWSSSGKDAGM
jgi:hypothetical protein